MSLVFHYLIDPGKSAQNGKFERSHRVDQEKFYDKIKFYSFKDLRVKLKSGTDNTTKHYRLNGKTPNGILELFN